MPDIDMKLLRSFLSVAAERNFSRAADRLGYSQGTLSLRIQNLERMLDIRLFNRDYHSVELTLAGRELLPQVQILVDQHDMLFDRIHGSKVAGSVKLGIAEDYVQTTLSRLMRVVGGSFPSIELNTTAMLSARLSSLVEARGLDLAIVSLPTPLSQATVLSRPRLVWVAAPDFVADPSKPWPLALYPAGCVFKAAALAALKQNGIRHREVLNSASGEVIKCAVSSATAISVMAEGTVPNDFVVLDKAAGLPDLPDTCIQLLERADGLSRAAQHVKASIVKLVGA